MSGYHVGGNRSGGGTGKPEWISFETRNAPGCSRLGPAPGNDDFAPAKQARIQGK